MKPIIVRDLYPTGTCFDDIDHIWKMIIKPKMIDKGEDVHQTIRVCHGILHKLKGREPYAHAWVENLKMNEAFECKRVNSKDGELCVIGVKRRDFHRSHRIKDFTSYTLREFSLLQLKYGHSGPFVDRYHVLTNDPEFRAAPESSGSYG